MSIICEERQICAYSLSAAEKYRFSSVLRYPPVSIFCVERLFVYSIGLERYIFFHNLWVEVNLCGERLGCVFSLFGEVNLSLFCVKRLNYVHSRLREAFLCL